jgi:hypothetical protein
MWPSDHLRRAALWPRALAVAVTFGRNQNSRPITIERCPPQIRNRTWLESPGLPPPDEFVALRQLKDT